jgi:hypothetical protein
MRLLIKMLRAAARILILATPLLTPAAGDAQRGAPTAQPNMDSFASKGCETPDRTTGCAPVRWGWGNCPGSREACDWCYGQHGVFAYVRRTNRTYKLASGCENLEAQDPSDVFWVVTDEGTRDRMEEARANCQDSGRLGLVCQVDPRAYRQPSRTSSPATPPSAPSQEPEVQRAAQHILDGWGRQDAQLEGGVSYTAASFAGQRLHALRIAGANGFRVALASGSRGVSLGDAVAGRGVRGAVANRLTGGVTGTFSNWPALAPSGGPKPAIAPGGPVIQGGKVVLANRTIGGQGTPLARSFLGWTGSGFLVQDLPATDAASFSNALGRLGVNEGLGGLGRLLAGGRDVHVDLAQRQQRLDRNQAGDTRNARVVAGVSRDGGTLIVLVQEGNGNAVPPRGAGTQEVAAILLSLGAWEGVILDGGGSAQIAIPSRGVNNHASDGRTLPTWILF